MIGGCVGLDLRGIVKSMIQNQQLMNRISRIEINMFFMKKICISSVTTMVSDNYKYILDYSQVVNFSGDHLYTDINEHINSMNNNINNCNRCGNAFIFA